MSAANPEQMSDGTRRLALATLATVGTAFAGLQSIIVPALPQLRESLNIDEPASAWILTASLLATSVFTPLLGSVGDLYGRKRMLLVSVIVMVIGTVVSALAPSLPPMLVGRALQGVGGGIFPLAFAIVRDTFPAARVPGSIGLISSLLGVGGGLGLVVPGPIVDGLGYQWLFWFPAILAVLTIPGLLAWVPRDRNRRRGRADTTSAVLMGLGLGLGLPALANVVVIAVPPDQVGAATGVNTIMRTIGGAIGGQVTLTLVATGDVQASPGSGFIWAFAVCASLAALAAPIAIALHGRSSKPSMSMPADPLRLKS